MTRTRVDDLDRIKREKMKVIEHSELGGLFPPYYFGVTAIERGDENARIAPIRFPIQSYRTPLPSRLPKEDFESWRKRQSDLGGRFLSPWEDIAVAVSRLETAEIVEVWCDMRFGMPEVLIRLSVFAEFFLEEASFVEFFGLEFTREPRGLAQAAIDRELLGRVFRLSDPKALIRAKTDTNPLIRLVANEMWMRYPEAETGLTESQRFALKTLLEGGPEMLTGLWPAFHHELGQANRIAPADGDFYDDMLHLWQDGAIERVELRHGWPTSTVAISDLGRQVLSGNARVNPRGYWIGGVHQAFCQSWYRTKTGDILLLDYPTKGVRGVA